MNGVELIERERNRQLKEHPLNSDLQWDEDQLARAASVYASPEEVFRYDGRNYRKAWPWLPDWDKRGKYNRVKQLIIAGAWTAAEIDRRLIKEMKKSRSVFERFFAAWFLYRFTLRLPWLRSLWCALKLSWRAR